MFRILRKADFILLAAVLAAAVLCAVLFFPRGSSGGSVVVITVNGQEFGHWPLSEDRTVTVSGYSGENVVRIADGTVTMESATCRNQVCVESGTIAQINQRIVCLPNRVVVEIREGTGEDTEKDTGTESSAPEVDFVVGGNG